MRFSLRWAWFASAILLSCTAPGGPARSLFPLEGDTVAVTITSPGSGATFYDQLHVSASIADAAAPIVQAQLLANGVPQLATTQEPWSFFWVPSTLPAGDYQLTVQATDANGNVGVSAPVTVTILAGPILTALNPTSITVPGAGGVFSLSAILSAPATPGGQNLALSSSDPSVASVDPSVTVLAGQTTWTVGITLPGRTVAASATITVRYRNVTLSVPINVTPASAPLFSWITFPGEGQNILSMDMEGGLSATGFATFSGSVPIASPALVALSTDSPLVTVPANVTVPAGQFKAEFPFTTAPVPTRTLVTITGTWTGHTETGRVFLNPGPIPSSVVLNPTTVLPGQSSTATLTLSSTAPAGGLVVPIFGSFDAFQPLPAAYPVSLYVTTPSSVTIPAGQQVARFALGATALSGGYRPAAVVNLASVSISGRLQVPRALPAGNAVYDPFLKVPRCDTVGAYCDSGGQISGRSWGTPIAEVNAPNTINSSCLDGPLGYTPPPGGAYYHIDSSLDRIKVSTLDGSALGAGKSVRVELNTFGQSRADIFSAPNANSPVWTFIASLNDPGVFGHVLSTTFTLPVGSLQAIRAVWTTLATPQACATGPFDDRDDLVFATDNGGPPTNVAPVVAAGPDQTLIAMSTASLVGVVTDDGLPGAPTILTTRWSQIGGPGTVIFGDASAAGTTATFSEAGTYTLRLSANDGARWSSDDVIITIYSAAPTNHAPVADGGPDQILTQPATTVMLGGSVSDDGLPGLPGAHAITWSLVSGPAPVAFANPTSASTSVRLSAVGNYVLRLTVSDGDLSASDDVTVTVNPVPPANQPPVINAGPDQAVTLPAGASLVGTATDDGLPAPPATLTTMWTAVSGPGTVIFTNGSAATTTATFTTPGDYVLRLTGSDTALSSSDDVTITVSPPLNQPPVANAGPDQTVTLPASANLVGTASDDNLPNPPGALTFTWSTASGPGTATFTNAGALATLVAFPVSGTYVLRLTANDGGLSVTDDVTVTVNPQPNQPPAVNAGLDLTVRLPNAVTLNGTVADDGLPNPPGVTSVAWSKISGPGTVTFSNPSTVSPSVAFSAAGSYVLRLTASDGAMTDSDDVAVTVNPAPINLAPLVNAGPDQAVRLPATASLSGTVTDDGLPNPPGLVTMIWSRVGGPGLVTFGNPSVRATSAAFSAAGIYVLRLTASDGALSRSDDLIVVVAPAPINRAPTVNAGSDRTVTLPAAASLSGTVTDDGLPNPPGLVTTTWSKVSGAGTVTFASASSRNTTATFSVAGTYVLRLTASDGALSVRDDLTVTVRRPR